MSDHDAYLEAIKPPFRKITARVSLTDRHGKRWTLQKETTYDRRDPDQEQIRRHFVRRLESEIIHQVFRQNLFFGSTIGDLSIDTTEGRSWTTKDRPEEGFSPDLS